MSSKISKLVNLRSQAEQLSRQIKAGTFKSRVELLQELPVYKREKFRILFQIFLNIPDKNLFTEEFDIEKEYNEICWSNYLKEGNELNQQVYFYAEAKFLSLEGKLEDLRPLVLFLYRQDSLSAEQEKLIIEAILLKTLDTIEEPSRIIQLLLLSLEFLGIPVSSPRTITTVAENMEQNKLCDLLSKLDTIDVIFSHPTYLEEIVENLTWDTFEQTSSVWLSQRVMAQAFSSYFTKLIQKTKDLLGKEKIPVEDAITKIGKVFIDNGINLPISFSSVFQHLADSVIPNPINMESIGQIPQEILPRILPEYTYSAKKRNRLRSIHFLGGCGIGRSSILVSTDKANILMDFGLAVSNSQIPRWSPLLHGIDAILISHAHLDHVGALPFLYSDIIKYEGPWFSLPLTKQFASILLKNNRMLLSKGVKKRVRKRHSSISECISTTNLARAYDNYVPLSLNTKIEIAPDTFLTVYSAGHIYGSGVFYLEIGDKTVLYSGDMNLDSSATLEGAKIPYDADITIFDGTYWGRPPFNQEKAEKTLVEAVTNHKRTIIPAFSLGRTQEMLTLLERNSLTKDHSVNVVGMGAQISKIVDLQGNYTVPRHFDPKSFQEGSIVITGGGMLQGGLARELLDQTRDDSQTSVVLCGYQAPNTLGWALNNDLAKEMYHQSIYRARISAHTSSDALKKFITEIEGKKIMVHSPFNEQDDLPQIPSIIIPRIGNAIQF